MVDAQAEVPEYALAHIVKFFLIMYKYTFGGISASGEAVSALCNLSVRSPWGQRWRKRQFSDHPKTVISVLAMVIRIVMTIASKKMTVAAARKTVLGKAENRGKKGVKSPRFVKVCYFYSPHGTPKQP